MKFRTKGKQNKGVTLIEIMVYTVLVGFILSGVYGTLIFSMRYFNTISRVSEMQDSVLFALSRLEMDMSETRASSVKNEAEDFVGKEKSDEYEGIIFPVLKDDEGKYSFTSDGQVHWQGWMCYYLVVPDNPNDPGPYNLVMKRKDISSPVADDPDEDPYKYSTVEDFVNDTTLNRQVIARRVKMLGVSRKGAKNFEIRIIVDGSENETRPYSIEAKTELMLRN